MLNQASAAEWQWSIPDGQARVYLWIPEDCQRVRGVMLANQNMIEQGILEHSIMRTTLSKLGFAQIWAVPTLEQAFDFHNGAGEHFQRIVDALAAESGYDELKFSPVVPLGHSACATFPWNFAACNPQRTLAVLSVHGDAPQTRLTGYGRPNIDWGDRTIDGVPGLMVMSENEWWEDRLTPAFTFMAKHPRAPLAFFANVGRGHFDYSDQLVSFLAMFVQKAAEQRLPAESPLNGQVPLKPIDPKTGWRIERWHKDQPPTVPAAPYAQYGGDPNAAFWCFDEEMAQATEAEYAANRGKRPQLVAFAQGDKVYSGEPAEPRFDALDDGISFRLTGRFLDTVSGNGDNPAKWASLPKDTPLGHAAGGGQIVISRIVGPVAQTDADTFSLCFGRAEYPADRRTNDIWLLASHPGDEQYKSAVQQGVVRALPNKNGAPQKITFSQVPDQSTVEPTSIKLSATSDAGLPVQYYILQGPAKIDGDTVILTAIPPRTRFPVKITVVAWQWGRAAAPAIQTATPVEMSFAIIQP